MWDDETDDLNDDEFPDDDPGDDDELETIDCPICGTSVYEESQRCPVCGETMNAITNPWSGRAWWWIALGLLGVMTTLGLMLLP